MIKFKNIFWDSIWSIKEKAEKWAKYYEKEYGFVCKIEKSKDGWNLFIVGVKDDTEVDVE